MATSSARCGMPFVRLSHSCRTFYKTHDPPQLLPLLLRRPHAAQPTLATPLSTLYSSWTIPSLDFAPQRRRFRSTAGMATDSVQWPAKRVRQTFFDYFEERGHTIGMCCRSAKQPRHRDAIPQATSNTYSNVNEHAWLSTRSNVG